MLHAHLWPRFQCTGTEPPRESRGPDLPYLTPAHRGPGIWRWALNYMRNRYRGDAGKVRFVYGSKGLEEMGGNLFIA